ncbi:MAG: hypothetical protein NVSMB62_18570 [Acidobacteriaceae bacterium]
MAVPPIGLLLLLLGPILMIVRPRWLYIATIFFLPFTATAVINVGSGANASAVQASMYLGALLIGRYAVVYARKGVLPFPQVSRSSLVWLGLFIAVTVVSLVMPLWINGRESIPAERLFDLSSTPLYLTSHNVTGVMYMVFGFLVSYLTAVLNQNAATLRLSVKCFMAGSIFAALWSVLEFACKLSGVPYPAAVFNTSASLSANGYMQSSGEFSRLSSVTVEPSIFSQTLLIAIALYLPFIFSRRRLFGRGFDRAFFFLLIAVICLSTSSTAYLGILILILVTLALLVSRGMLRLQYLVLPATAVVLATLLYFIVPQVQQVLDNALFSKAQGGSALERLMTITNSYQMFLKYPVLGIGWASITSHDLIVDILANAGVVGLVTFSVSIFAMFRYLYRSIRARPASRRIADVMQLDFALFLALAVMLITSAFSGFLNTFPFFWFVLGLAIAEPSAQLSCELAPARSRKAIQQPTTVPIP